MKPMGVDPPIEDTHMFRQQVSGWHLDFTLKIVLVAIGEDD